MGYFTYILQSDKDESYYIGHTEDVKKRLDLHNQGESKYTSKKLPGDLSTSRSLKQGRKLARGRLF